MVKIRTIEQWPQLLIAVLICLMIATRTNHFGSFVSLPSASLAVFFLAGFYVQRWGAFLILAALAWLSDYWILSATPIGAESCFTAAYGFIFVGYYLVWRSGQWASSNVKIANPVDVLIVICVSITAISGAFFISNASYYLLSGSFEGMSLSEYITRVARYYPSYVANPMAYLGLSAVLHWMSITLLATNYERLSR